MDYLIASIIVVLAIWGIVKAVGGDRYASMTEEEFEEDAKRSSRAGSMVSAFQKIFEKWGTGALAASTAVPFPFPTSMFFAAAGASNYRTDRFLAIVAVGRAVRFSAIAGNS